MMFPKTSRWLTAKDTPTHETKLDGTASDSHNTVWVHTTGDTMGAVGSEAGKLSGHDWKRWAAGVARSAAMAALTYAADNVAGLGLSPLQVLLALS